jgi:HEAT repeat protein
MALTSERVRQLLLPEEPDYAAAARLGPALLPHLPALIRGPDEMLASKAAYLATLVSGPGAETVVRDAARSPSPLVRIAVAGGAPNLRSPQVGSLLIALLGDADPGVRKTALKAAAGRKNGALIAKIRDLSRRDPAPSIRTLAANALGRSGRGQA